MEKTLDELARQIDETVRRRGELDREVIQPAIERAVTAVVSDIKRWEPRPHDIFVVETPVDWNPGMSRQVAEYLEYHWAASSLPGRVIVLPPGCTAAVLNGDKVTVHNIPAEAIPPAVEADE